MTALQTFLCLPLIVLAGCTAFRVTQIDESITRQIDESTEERKITTKLTGTAWFSSAQAITGIKALQTDKTQSFGAGTFGQQGATNSLQSLNALARIAEAVNPK